MPASSRTAHTVAEVLSKGGVILLHSSRGAEVAISHCTVDHVEASLSLIQPQLEVGSAGPREVLRPPLNVEDAIGSSTTYRREYAKPAINQIEIIPVW